MESIGLRLDMWDLDRLKKAIDNLNKILPIGVGLTHARNAGIKDNLAVLSYEPMDGSNCICLFGMWYDLDSETFFLTKADTVEGVYLFTAQAFYKGLGLVCPKDVNNRVLEYKATGKIDRLLDVDASEQYTNYLTYFLQSPVVMGSREDALRKLWNIVENVVSLGTRIRGITRDGSYGAKAKNVWSTVNHRNWDAVKHFKGEELALYSASVKADVYSNDSMSVIKAKQAVEIIEAESTMASKDFITRVTLDVDKIPTFNRITGREKSSIKTSLSRNPNLANQSDATETMVKDLVSLKRFMVELGKCATKAREV